MLKGPDKTVGIIEVVMPSEETFSNIFFAAFQYFLNIAVFHFRNKNHTYYVS